MKLTEVLKSENRWRKHPTKKGVLVRIGKSPAQELADAAYKKQEADWKKWEKEQAKMNKALDSGKPYPAIDYNELGNLMSDAIGSAIPDGDPIDRIIPFMKQHNVANYNMGPHLDKAAKKEGYKSWDDMLAYNWDLYYEATAKDADEYKELVKNNPWR